MKTSTLTRADIVDTLVREVDLPRQQASDLLEFVLESMIQSLVQKKNVKISSFGSFMLVKRQNVLGGIQKPDMKLSLLRGGLFPLNLLNI